MIDESKINKDMNKYFAKEKIYDYFMIGKKDDDLILCYNAKSEEFNSVVATLLEYLRIEDEGEGTNSN